MDLSAAKLRTILWQLTAVGDNDLLVRFSALGTITFNLLDHIHTFNDGTEDDMTVVQPGSFHGRNEELWAIRVWSSVGLRKKVMLVTSVLQYAESTYHWQCAWCEMLQGEVLILELVAIDGFATSAIVIGEITTLAHEVWNHAVECWVFVAETLLAGAQGTEVFACLWYHISTELWEQ